MAAVRIVLGRRCPRPAKGAATFKAAATRSLPYLIVVITVALALVAVGLVQSAVGSLGLAPLLYLLPVTLAAARWGRGPAILAVVLAVLGHDVLFVEPVGTLTVARPDEAVGLALLLITAIVIAQLADKARRGAERAQEAEVMRRSEELKTALLRAVSHDLRTPLASIKASVSSLRQDGVLYTEEDQRELLAAIEDETDHLNRILGNLLEVSRLEAGAMTLNKRPEDLSELVRAVLQRFGPAQDGRRVSLDVQGDPSLVVCDYVQIDHVLSNLIDNAFRHTPPQTPVHIALSQQDGAVLLQVTDRGPGVAVAERERVFHPFERGHTKAAGTGLGLAIAKGLVEAHGGRLWITDAEGGGACFSFTLPVAEVKA